MKKIIITIFGIGLLFACDNITDLNVDPKSPPTSVEGSTLFTSAQKNLTDFMASSNVNLNIFRLVDQYWTETTYTDESNYDLGTRAIPDGIWHTLYRDVLKDLDASSQILTEEGASDNAQGCVEITKVFTWYVLVDIFGDLPYSQAMSLDNLSPVYDDASTVYHDLISRLDAALAKMSAGDSGLGSADLLFGGDTGKWIKFGNSLKLKMGMELSDVDATTAKSTVEGAAANTIASNDDNAAFYYTSAPPNTNPIWVDLVQSGRKDFVAANTIVDMMVALNDPRVPEYFTEDAAGGYTGGTNGASNNYATFSKPADRILEPTMEHLWMDYAEVEFLKAEAVERGYNVGGTAQSHYNNAITASMAYWGVADADVAAYLAKPEVNYPTAAGNYKQKIGTQEYLALYNRGFEGWTSWRRLDFPVLVAPPDALSDVPLRFTYPSSEANLNQTNYDAASAKVGGDEVATKIFWDKN